MNGEEWTRAMIIKHGLRDGEGREHVPYGVMTWSAKFYAHVCFDNHPSIGRKIHFMTVAALRDAVLKYTDDRPIGARLNANATENTGYGFLISPDEVAGVKSISIEPYPPPPGERDKQAVWIVKQHLARSSYVSKDASLDQQLSGIDLVFGKDGLSMDQSMEVKCREEDKSFPKLFIQISETNTGSAGHSMEVTINNEDWGSLFDQIDASQQAVEPPASLPAAANPPPPPEPFVHYCHCGKECGFGFGVSLRHGKEGRWFCMEHRPER